MSSTLRGIMLLLFPATVLAQQDELNIIPKPVHAELKSGTFGLSSSTRILARTAAAKKSAAFFNDYLKKFYGFQLKPATTAGPNTIVIATKVFIRKPDHEEGYTLDINGHGVEISGNSDRGSFYGIQTLIQLLPVENRGHIALPALHIDDYPRFAYRGMHLDVGRHFFDVAFVKKYIDFIALHKMNTFHWHLTEDQGWRIEIKKYPLLTSVGAWRDGTIIGRYPGKGNDGIRTGGYYTQAEVREIVKYAADRFITVIPEIEMPGHSLAALTAYPQLGCTGGPYQVQQTWGVFKDIYCAGKDSVFTFLQNVLDEVIPLFPSTYIHIGGDEAPKDSWKKCPFCQKRIHDLGLKDEHELQSWFIQRIEKYLNAKGRRIIGWDEILEGGLAPNATVMSWRGEKGGIEAAAQHHDVIMTPGTYCYFDHSQSKSEDSVTIGGYLPLETVYKYSPVPAGMSESDAHYVLGAQGNVWTEYIANPSKAEYMVFPRMSALSEVLWSPEEARNWDGFLSRMEMQYRRYGQWGIHYNTKGIRKGE